METMAGEGKADAQTQHETYHLDDILNSMALLQYWRSVNGKFAVKEVGIKERSPKANVCQHVPRKRPMRCGRQLLEVFSVKFPEFGKHNIRERMHGCIVVHSVLSYVVLDRIKIGAPLNIDAEGSIRLRGPNRAIRACDYVRLVANLFNYKKRTDQFISDEYEPEDLTMWNITRSDYNMLLTRSLKCQFGPIVVNYAVYNDGAEAWVDVRVLACQFPAPAVYGTITVRNSDVPNKKAESVLFVKNREEDLYLDVDEGNSAHLPLSRRKTVHPYGSYITMSLNIMQRGNTEAQDQPIATNADLRFATCLSGQEVQTTGNGVCLIEVSITWHEECKPFGNGPRVI